MLGVTFGSKHSYNDWGIWLEDTHINPPLPKRYIVDVPARNGLLDLTPELTPTIRFENRTLTFNFRVKAGDWSTLVSQIYGDIHGRTLDVVSDLDPNWHWHGCVTVDDFSSDERTGRLVITVDADPFKLSNTENSYTVNGNGTITCVVDRMEISPAFEIEAPTTVIYGDSSYVIESTATTEKTLSGDIVSFVDGTANPAVDLTADVTAVQDLHGYSHPWAGGAGKNKLPNPNFNGEYVTVTVTTDTNGIIKLNGTASGGTNLYTDPFILKAGSYYYSDSVTGTFPSNSSARTQLLKEADASQVTGTTNNNAADIQKEFTLDADTSVYFRVRLNSGSQYSNCTLSPMIRLQTETDATFAPYANICPISGWTGCEVTRAGKNLLNNIDATIINGYITGSKTIASSSYNRIVVIPCKPNTDYTYTWNRSAISGNDDSLVLGYDHFPAIGEVGDTTLFLISESGNHVAFRTKEKEVYLAIKYANVNTSDADATLAGSMLELGTTATAYEPYNGQTYTIDLDGTRYGGTLDVTTGVLTVTHGIVDLGTLTWSLYYGTVYANVSGAKLPQSGAVANIICSQYKASNITSVLAKSENGIIAINEGQSRVNLYDASLSDKTAGEVKTALSGVQLVYELATPQVVQLTPTQVTTLLGQNNIWADSGEVEVTYLAQDFTGKTFYIPDLELTEGSHELTIQGTGTTTVTYTNGRL